MKKEGIDYKWSEICWNKGIQISLTICFQQITLFRLNRQKEQQNKVECWMYEDYISITLDSWHTLQRCIHYDVFLSNKNIHQRSEKEQENKDIF